MDPKPSEGPKTTNTRDPVSGRLPLIHLESAVATEMGQHTPGTNSDAYYVAKGRSDGTVLALVCDGITGEEREAKLLTGAWMSQRLASQLPRVLQLEQAPNPGEVLSLLQQPAVCGRIGDFILGAIPSESLDLAVQQFMKAKGFMMKIGPYASYIDSNGASRVEIAELQRRYEYHHRINISLLERDAVTYALEVDPLSSGRALLSGDDVRIRLSLVHLLRELAPAFHREFSDHSPIFGGTTITGCVERSDHFRIFWAGDSSAHLVSSGGIVHLSTPHQSSQGMLTSCVGIEAGEDAHRLVSPVFFNSLSIPKVDLKENTFLVLASDGCYFQYFLHHFESALSSASGSASQILAGVEEARGKSLQEIQRNRRNISIDDYTAVVIKIQ